MTRKIEVLRRRKKPKKNQNLRKLWLMAARCSQSMLSKLRALPSTRLMERRMSDRKLKVSHLETRVRSSWRRKKSKSRSRSTRRKTHSSRQLATRLRRKKRPITQVPSRSSKVMRRNQPTRSKKRSSRQSWRRLSVRENLGNPAKPTRSP